MPREQSTMITIRVKDSILEQIDAAAEDAGMSRAQFMIEAAIFAGQRPAKVMRGHVSVPMPALNGQTYDIKATELPDISDRATAFYRETAKDILSGAKPATAPGPYTRPAHAANCHCLMCRS